MSFSNRIIGSSFRDKMHQASVKEVALGVVQIADAVQLLPKHVRALSAAGFLKLYMERFEVEPQDLMTALGNLRDSVEGKRRVEWAAIKSYLNEDLLK